MEYLLGILAAYRLALDLTQEEGPFSLYERLQEWAGDQSSWVKRGVLCPMCLSFWLALFFAVLIAPKHAPKFILAWLGMAGGAAFLIKLVR